MVPTLGQRPGPSKHEYCMLKKNQANRNILVAERMIQQKLITSSEKPHLPSSMLIMLTASFNYHCWGPPYVTSQLLLALQTQPEKKNCLWGELVLGRVPLETDSYKSVLHYSLKQLQYIHLSHRLFSRPLHIKLALREPIQPL